MSANCCRFFPVYKIHVCLNVSGCFSSLLRNNPYSTVYSRADPLAVSEITKEENIKAFIDRLQQLVIPSAEKKLNPTAAVFIPFCIDRGKVCLLYTVRKSDLRRHGRQVSFPGGKQDINECLNDTALRETQEELGISRDMMKVWGCGQLIYATEYTILPVIGFVGDVSNINMKPNPEEVESVFTVPLSHFCNVDNCRFTKFRKDDGYYITPAFINIQQRIWGYTGFITHIILLGLLPNTYKPYIKI